MSVIGIDLGGTNVKLGLLTADSTLRYTSFFETHSHRSPESIVADIAEAVCKVKAQAERDNLTVQGLGIGVPATLELSKRQTLNMPNFAEAWYGFGVADALEETTGLRVALVNDARAFVLAESQLGAAKGIRNVFGVILGTGVGGGVVVNGQLHLGSGGLAGEFGHHVIDPNGLRCGCGGYGCLETVASAPALVAGVTRPFLHGRCPVLHTLAQGDLRVLSAKLIAEAARQGDAACREALERVGQALGVATANVITLFAPECIVVGGGLAGAHDLLFPVIRQSWQRHAAVTGEHLPAVKLAKLEQPGVVGAALYARNTSAL